MLSPRQVPDTHPTRQRRVPLGTTPHVHTDTLRTRPQCDSHDPHLTTMTLHLHHPIESLELAARPTTADIRDNISDRSASKRANRVDRDLGATYNVDLRRSNIAHLVLHQAHSIPFIAETQRGHPKHTEETPPGGASTFEEARNASPLGAICEASDTESWPSF